jgi:hypothetical protein
LYLGVALTAVILISGCGGEGGDDDNGDSERKNANYGKYCG